MEIVWSKLAYEHFLEILIYVENNFWHVDGTENHVKRYKTK